ncbi:MAG: hypothetical protein RLZZ142_1683 [Verrucomicrobiota bacterium]
MTCPLICGRADPCPLFEARFTPFATPPPEPRDRLPPGIAECFLQKKRPPVLPGGALEKVAPPLPSSRGSRSPSGKRVDTWGGRLTSNQGMSSTCPP